MRQLLPDPADVDPGLAHAAVVRMAPPGMPWVLVNMVASLDGATAVGGTSGALGGSADKAVFSAIRAVADVILVAAGTARAESYGPPRPSPARQDARRARGQSALPRLAVVTRSLDLDPAAALFNGATEAPLIYTTTTAPSDRRRALDPVAEVVAMGDDGVDLSAVLADLADRGHGVVLGEGGPALNGQLVASGLVDEVNVSIAPALVGGDSARLAHGPTDRGPLAMDLAHLWYADGFLFARYVRC